MTIVLNGQDHETPQGATVIALLEMIDLAADRVAVEVNGRVVPRAGFPELALHPGDRVEVVHFVGGG
jgi:sulfur carrier protein